MHEHTQHELGVGGVALSRREFLKRVGGGIVVTYVAFIRQSVQRIPSINEASPAAAD